MPDVNRDALKLIADVALLAGGQLALVRYPRSGDYDNQTGWFLPDDELGFLEHPEDAARRILQDQLSAIDLAPRLDHIESFRGNDRSWHLVFHFVAELSDPSAVKAGESVSSLEWFPLDQLPERTDVAHHGWALDVIAKITASNPVGTTTKAQ